MCSLNGWNWPLIPFELPSEIKTAIQVVPAPIFARNGDKLAWKMSPKGDFNARSAYLLALDQQDLNSSIGPGFGSSTLPKIQMFIWKCLHQAIGVKERLVAKGMHLDDTCLMCHSASETINHALRDCSVVKPIWYQLGINNNNRTFFSLNTNEWLTSNAKSKRTPSNHPP